MRAQPTDRLKTNEELAKEEKLRLERLEVTVCEELKVLMIFCVSEKDYKEREQIIMILNNR